MCRPVRPCKKRLWATDGIRLHAVNNFDLGDKPLFGEVSGKTILFYDVEEDTSKKGPDYTKIVPDYTEMVQSTEPVLFSEKQKDRFDGALTTFYIKSRAPLKTRFVSDLKGFDYNVFWFEKNTCTRPWLFKEVDSKVFAVIMPMNIEDYWR